MSNKIPAALDAHFSTHRLIFWYDDGGRMEDVFNGYTVPDNGLKLRIDKNEFRLRHHILKEHPGTRALLYSASSRPPDAENWLLDLQLSHFLFASDQAAMVLQDLELNDLFLPLIREHQAFFANRKERLNPLRFLVDPAGETPDTLRQAMIAVLCASSRRDLSEITLNLLLDSAFSESPRVWTALEKFGLRDYLLQLWKEEFGYHSDSPSPLSLLNHLLTRALSHQLGSSSSTLSGRLYAMVDRWRKNQDHLREVQNLLNRAEKEFNIPHELSRITSLKTLVSVDLYTEADRIIFSRLLESLLAGSIPGDEALSIIEARRETYWYKSGSAQSMVLHYQVLYHYLKFRRRLERFKPDFSTLDEGWERYREDYCLLDGDYRRFIDAVEESDPSLFADLLSSLEKDYTEAYLQPLAQRWQTLLDADPAMETLSAPKMRSFFVGQVFPYLKGKKSLFIIISDGFRYELARELQEELINIQGFKVNLRSLTAPSPSYTQLGMASLLPHSELVIASNADSVLADNRPTTGWENRRKVIEAWIQANIPGKTVRVIKADTFSDMPRTEQREFVKGIDLVIIHSPGVDAVGDDVKTETHLPKAAVNEIRRIRSLCETITRTLGRTFIMLTADHGFLYRHREVPDTERSKLDTSPHELRRDHRFIFTHQPAAHPALDSLEPDHLTWTAPFHVQIARGVNRIRRPGGGTRYVHGGRMPQEICVPLMHIQHVRTDDVRPVDIAVLDAGNRITSGQVTISFLQEEPVEAKRPPREIEAVFISPDGEEVSNTHRLIFDSTHPSSQNRSRKVQFIFTSAADAHNGRTITLQLKTIRDGSIQVPYKTCDYQFRKQITGVDF